MKNLILTLIILVISREVVAQKYLGIEFMGADYEMLDVMDLFPDNEVDYEVVGGSKKRLTVEYENSSSVNFLFGDFYKEDLNKKMTSFQIQNGLKKQVSRFYVAAKIKYGEGNGGFKQKKIRKRLNHKTQSSYEETLYRKAFWVYNLHVEGDYLIVKYEDQLPVFGGGATFSIYYSATGQVNQKYNIPTISKSWVLIDKH